MRKLLLIAVETDKNNDYLADALSVEVTLKLRPFVPNETVELLKLKGLDIAVLDQKDAPE
jgi:hypothetical protein